MEGGGKGPGEGAVGARESFNGCSFSLAGMAEGGGGGDASGESVHSNMHMVDNIVLYTWKSLGG